MSSRPPVKLLPRNVAALRPGQDAGAATRLVTGNPVSTRLEAGVGNCFPGLEFDARNLERRFFPYLEIELGDQEAEVVAVDIEAVKASKLPAADKEVYQNLAKDLRQGQRWHVDRMVGDFGPLGVLQFALEDLTFHSFGPHRLPSDAWTAARLLKEGSAVTLHLSRRPKSAKLTIAGNRVRYLEDDGALARMFHPGELTQSLCSPWTHDFRDCACYYWASNHPDIALPPLPTEASAADPKWNRETDWERSDRTAAPPPTETSAGDILEMAHHEINRNWQHLNFVLERREQVGPYQSSSFKAKPLPDQKSLEQHLRFAAGVEIAVMQEYLCAAWSLQQPQRKPDMLRDDLRAAFAEILRIAVGEMRHLRAVNDVLARFPSKAKFVPALRVATRIPIGPAGMTRVVKFRAATAETLDDFVAIEAPSESVDGVYARILATLEGGAGDTEQQQAIRNVMAEGADHWQTFLFIREWLGRHDEQDYLIRDLKVPAKSRQEHKTLQSRYRTLLGTLFEAYTRRIPAGAADVIKARAAMLAPDGIHGALDALAKNHLLVVFDRIKDPNFAPLKPPPDV
jgi:hypothetical protein